jgi:hypothetical protein
VGRFFYNVASSNVMLALWLGVLWICWSMIPEPQFPEKSATEFLKECFSSEEPIAVIVYNLFFGRYESYVLTFINVLVYGGGFFFITRVFRNWCRIIFYVPKPFWRLQLQPIYSSNHRNTFTNPFSGVLQRMKEVLTRMYHKIKDCFCSPLKMGLQHMFV